MSNDDQTETSTPNLDPDLVMEFRPTPSTQALDPDLVMEFTWGGNQPQELDPDLVMEFTPTEAVSQDLDPDLVMEFPLVDDQPIVEPDAENVYEGPPSDLPLE